MKMLERRRGVAFSRPAPSGLVASVFTAGMYQRYKNEIFSTHAKIAKTQRHDVQVISENRR